MENTICDGRHTCSGGSPTPPSARVPVCAVGPEVRRAEGAPSSPENVTKATLHGLDSALRLCEDGYIGTREKGSPMNTRRIAVSVAVGLLLGWGAGEGRAPSWDAYAGVRPEPTILGLTVTQITTLGLDIPADAR